MALSGFKAKAHPQQVSRRWPDDVDEVDDRATHPLDFAELDERFGPFTVDVAAAAHNTKCARFYDREVDGLAQGLGRRAGVVQSAVLRHRAMDPEGMVVLGVDDRDRDAAAGQPDRAGLVAAAGRALP